MFTLKEKKALITGATGGLGAAIARSLHSQGAHIAISGTRKEKLEDLAKELGDRVSILPCDLSNADATQSACLRQLQPSADWTSLSIMQALRKMGSCFA